MRQEHDLSVPDGKEKIILIGNPNVGKSVIFSYLTGRYVSVSNYPGTTIEITSGKLIGQKHVIVLDTPGINNLIPTSEDEVVTRNILLENPRAKVIQVANSSNLDRTLLLSLQLKEMGIRFVLCLNMMDESRDAGMKIDTTVLSRVLDVPVIQTVAIQRISLNKLIPALGNSEKEIRLPEIKYPEVITLGAQSISSKFKDDYSFKAGISMMIISSDLSLEKWVQNRVIEDQVIVVDKIVRETQSHFQRPVRDIITTARMIQARKITQLIVTEEETISSSILSKLGEWSHHRFGGLFIGGVVLFLMYLFVGVLGAGTLVNFFEQTVFGGWLIPLISSAVNTLFPIRFIQDLLVGQYGLLSMALSYSIGIVLPIVGTFFFAFSLLEDSGYLPRLAVMMNRLFKKMGLNGKAVLPMVLGLGCDTMATMTTRILDSKKERVLVTLLLALGIPCSAQLGVILGMLSALSPVMTLVWIGFVLLVLFSVGYLSSKIIPGRSSDFILELPPMRIPKLSNMLVKTVARIEWYLKEAVPLFFLGTLVLFVFDKTGLLVLIERTFSPVVEGFLGLPSKATEAFLIGFLRRDYGAAGLYNLFSPYFSEVTITSEVQIQIVVSMIAITLFMPCIANFFMIIKERGLKTALAMAMFILPFSIGISGLVNFLLRWIML